MAGSQVTDPERTKRRLLLAQIVLGEWTACAEATARGRVERRWQLTGDVAAPDLVRARATSGSGMVSMRARV